MDMCLRNYLSPLFLPRIMALPSPQCREEMEKSWKYIAEFWKPVEILVPQGDRFVEARAMLSSTHDLCVTMSMMVAMVALSNGAQMQIFPRTEPPLNLISGILRNASLK
eukprot:3063665-Amphidinium_carterae.1